MKIIGKKLIDDIEVPIIVECTSIEVEDTTTCGRSFNPDYCRLWMRGSHPAVSYAIIKTERYDKDNSGVRPFKWLNKNEADAILKYAAESDIIDLRELGNYQICYQEKLQSVYVMNDINEWNDEDIPILVKVVKEDA